MILVHNILIFQVCNIVVILQIHNIVIFNNIIFTFAGNETCDTPQILKRVCEFPILWYLVSYIHGITLCIVRYFRQSDTYNFLLIVKNDVSSHIEVVPITIYDVAREAQFSMVRQVCSFNVT